ncbi:hypothetical protein [Umezawaea beigongshangensis]|uniref:hypothetical protein n=1 Tax=Umezawaea beigongshangensis TaxID=2780383 RepID=UPI0018F1ACC8|nr:hypothetical protein [Umezawaea beigongshangensis]
MTESAGPLPPWVHRHRRAAALSGGGVLLLLLVWTVAVLSGGDDPAGQRLAAQRIGADEPTASSSAPPTAPPTEPPAGPPRACPDEAVQVVAEADRPGYLGGRQPVFRLVVGNTGPVACTRDIGRHLRELVVSTADGATRLWSSNDCGPAEGVQTRVLHPGERFRFGVTWVVGTSVPGCSGDHVPLAPGDYLLTARLGDLVGEPVVFRVS